MPTFIDQNTGFPDETPCPVCGWPMYCYLCSWDDEEETEIRLTPVAGDGAEADAGDIEGATRPAPEHDG